VNLLAARIVLRPRSLSEVLDLAVPFCLAIRRPLARLALVVLGPIAAAAAFLRLWQGWTWLQVWLALWGLMFLAEGVFTVAVGEALFRDPAELRARLVLGRFLRRLPTYLVTAIAHDIILAAASLLVFLLFFEAPREVFIFESVLLENASLGKAFGRSRALGRDRSFFCLGLWLAAVLLPALGAIVADLVGNVMVGFVLQMGEPLGDLWSHGGSAFAVLGALLATPVAVAARFLGYVDARTRKEGWDIQLRFMAWIERDEAERRRVA
jgi:hypothetical protein